MKLLFFTGSRGEWGYIKPILDICKLKKINYKICATNMHLLENYGYSLNEIKKDGFKVSDQIYMALDGYNSTTMTKSLGVLMTSFVDVVERIKPDWVIIAGDRGESLIATIVSSYMYVPVAHIQAGEVSGNIDGMARHAIGKFAHMHLTSNKDAFNRLLKLGEKKNRIKLVGAPQLDNLKKIKKNKSKRSDILKKIGIIKNQKYILVIYHPITEEYYNLKKYIQILIKSLNKIEIRKIWIMPNNDSGSSIIKNQIFKNTSTSQNYFENLSRDLYLELLKHSECIVGNSSSGLIEAPTFEIPSVNIGRRQHGRVKGKNIIQVDKYLEKDILLAIKKAMNKNFKKKLENMINPYGDGNSSSKIINILKKTKINNELLTKDLSY